MREQCLHNTGGQALWPRCCEGQQDGRRRNPAKVISSTNFRLALRFVLTVLLLGGVLQGAEPQLVAPDRTKQLVLDPRVIQSVTNAKLTLGTVEKEPRNPLFHADQPWENALNNLYPNVLWDAEAKRFKLWYKCVLNDKEVIAKMANPATIHDQGWFLLYATSRDGLAWEKPSVGQFEFAGTTANNAVARDTPNVGVFRDPHDPDATRRFKMVYDVGLGKPRVRFSPDGLKWSDPQEPKGFTGYNCDTHNNAFWDERSGNYVWFTKAFLGERLVTRFESTDFLNWKSSGVVLRSTVEEGRGHQTYCLPVFPYANGYLGYVMMYHVGTDRTVDCDLAWSPDTVSWTRLAPGTPFIPRGPKGSYDGACIYAPSGPAIAQDGKLLIFYGGDHFPHQGWKRHCLPSLARLRVDGFAGYEPITNSSEATVITQPMLVTGPIQVSADVRGSLSVSVLEEAGFTDAVISRDVTDGEVKWPGRDLSALRGKMVSLKFALRDAKLYAVRGLELVPAPVASTGVRKFAATLDVSLSYPGPTNGVVIRHTLDGSDPMANSPALRESLRLAQTTRVRARAFLPAVTRGGPEFDAVFTRREPRDVTWPTPLSQTFAFDKSASGWLGLDKLEHRATGGVAGGYVTASRGSGLRPFAYLPHNATNGLAGDWPTKFAGDGVNITFHTRSAEASGGFLLELFARDIAQWSYARLPKFTPAWQRVSVPVRWDWNDAEAEAAGWVRGLAAFSWRDTLTHLGKVVVVAGPGSGSGAFDLDEFAVTAFAD